MISVSANFTVWGDSYAEVLSEVKKSVAELFELEQEEVSLSKFNFDIDIQDMTDSTEFEEKSYKAEVIVKVRNV